MKKLFIGVFLLISLASFGQINLRCPVCPPSLHGVPDGYVLTDSSGNARWQSVPTGDSSNLWETSGGNLYPTDNGMLVGIGTTTPAGILDVASGNSRFYIDAANNFIQSSVRGGDDMISLYGDGAYSGHYFHVTVGDAGNIHMTQSLFNLSSADMQIGNLGGNGTGLVGVDNNGLFSFSTGAWSLTGNAGTDPAIDFVGTTDGTPLIVKASNVSVIVGNDGLFGVADTAEEGGVFIEADIPNRLAAIGDVFDVYNGTKISVDDSTKTITFQGATGSFGMTNSMVFAVQTPSDIYHTNFDMDTMSLFLRRNANEILAPKLHFDMGKSTPNGFDLGIFTGSPFNRNGEDSILSQVKFIATLDSGFVFKGIDESSRVISVKDSAGFEVFNVNCNGSIKIVDGTQGAGKVLTSDAFGNSSWQSLIGTPIKDSIAATGATISPAKNTAHVITSAGAITSATISFPSGTTGDWILFVFNKAIATVTNSGTGSGTVGLVAPLLGTSKTYVNINGSWY
jgi:hypothetical protein